MSEKESGKDRLWLWFGLSRSSWLTMPRVMMHQMPDHWQSRMADLCEEWDEHWDSSDMPSPRVIAVDNNGRFTKWPAQLLDYRHPCRGIIDRMRRAPDSTEEQGQ